MNKKQLMNAKSVFRLLLIFTLLIPMINFALMPATASTSSSGDSFSSWEPCSDYTSSDGQEEADSFVNAVRIIFLIAASLGPVFGTLFYILLTLGDTVQIDDKGKYETQARSALLKGFMVPIALAFCAEIGQRLTTTDISCFFPIIG